MATFAELTVAQHRVFEQIAIGNDGGHNLRTLAALVRHGMIVAEEVEGHWGKFPGTYTRYFVPVPWHIRWCEWCAEQPDTDKPETA